MISHRLTTGALFLLVGMLYERRHTCEIGRTGGLWKVGADPRRALPAPRCSRSIGLPGFSGFIGEFLSLIGTFIVDKPYAVVAAIGVILAAVYLLWAFQRVVHGRADRGEPQAAGRSTCASCACVVPLLALSLFLGLYPKPVLDRIEPSVEALHRARRAQVRLPASRASSNAGVQDAVRRRRRPSNGTSGGRR